MITTIRILSTSPHRDERWARSSFCFQIHLITLPLIIAVLLMMVHLTKAAGAVLGFGLAVVSAVPAAAPVPTAAPNVEDAVAKRATTCTFTNASAASKSKKSCSTIVLSNIAVPSGTTLDMTGLNSGTHVIGDVDTNVELC